jgi:periplasmic protein TonB
MSTRYILGVPIAAAITFGLFVFMRSLIASDEQLIPEDPNPDVMIVIGTTMEDTKTETNKPEELVKPEEDVVPPTARPEPEDFDDDPEEMGGKWAGTQGPEIIVSGPEVCGQPKFRVAPTYPRRAADQGVEGYAIIGFTVTKEGMIKDAHVIDDEPRGFFGSAALRAVKKWRYEPCVVNGKISEVKLQVQLVFELEE